MFDGGNNPRLDIAINMSGLRIKLAPPTIATFESPTRRLWQARCKHAMLLEQAVSRLMLGPFKSKKWEIRFDNIAVPFPVMKYLGSVSGSLIRLSW